MTVHDGDLFPDEDVSEQREGAEHGEQDHLVIELLHRQIVHLE